MSEKSREITGLLITIGDELLLGDILNGNSRHIALELRAKGFKLAGMVTVGDAAPETEKAFSEALTGFAFVIVTGGLGSTEDDRTTDAAAKVLGRPLVLNAAHEQWLRSYLAERGYQWTDAAGRMAMLPEGAVKMVGSTPMAGFRLEHLGVPWYFLPGVPWEMKELMARKVIPDLEQRFRERPFYLKRVLRFQSMSESSIGARLEELAGRPDLGVAIGYLPQAAENWVTLLAVAENEEEALRRVGRAKEEVLARLGSEQFSGEDGDALEVVIGRALRERNWKLALAESCTAGLLASKVASVPGASDYLDRALVTYSNGAKADLLGVAEDLLAAHGAVSAPVAEAMARGAREKAGVDAALAITGIAGPTGGSPDKPVGTVFIACADASGCVVEKRLFGGGREQVQERAAHAALVLLWRRLAP